MLVGELIAAAAAGVTQCEILRRRLVVSEEA